MCRSDKLTRTNKSKVTEMEDDENGISQEMQSVNETKIRDRCILLPP